MMFTQEIDRVNYDAELDTEYRRQFRRIAKLMRAELDALLASDLCDQHDSLEPPTETERRAAWNAVNEALKAHTDAATETIMDRLGIDSIDPVIDQQAAAWRRGGFGRVDQHSEVDL